MVQPAIDRWSYDQEKRWASLHRSAAERTRRRHGSGPLIAAKAWELQERGVAHLHLVVPYATPRERARADAYVAAIKELAPAKWFGFADLNHRGGTERAPAAAAAYVSKYIGKATGEGLMVKRPMYVGAFLTTATGVTMRTARLKRFAYMVLADHELTPDDLSADWTPATWCTIARSVAPARAP